MVLLRLCKGLKTVYVDVSAETVHIDAAAVFVNIEYRLPGASRMMLIRLNPASFFDGPEVNVYQSNPAT